MDIATLSTLGTASAGGMTVIYRAAAALWKAAAAVSHLSLQIQANTLATDKLAERFDTLDDRLTQLESAKTA